MSVCHFFYNTPSLREKLRICRFDMRAALSSTRRISPHSKRKFVIVFSILGLRFLRHLFAFNLHNLSSPLIRTFSAFVIIVMTLLAACSHICEARPSPWSSHFSSSSLSDSSPTSKIQFSRVLSESSQAAAISSISHDSSSLSESMAMSPRDAILVLNITSMESNPTEFAEEPHQSMNHADVASTSSHAISPTKLLHTLPQNRSDTSSTDHDDGAHRQGEFFAESRRAFWRLNDASLATTAVRAPLLPDEERRQIWLQRHHRRKLIQERRDHSLRQNRFLALSSANFTNFTNHTCKGDLFKHKVRMAGCEPKIIINRFCHGSCSSVYIPKLHERNLRASFRSFAACVPAETDLVEIRLNCPGRLEREISRTVMRVKRCACRNIAIQDYDELGAEAD